MNDFYILLAQFFSTCLLQYFYICLGKIKQIKNSNAYENIDLGFFAGLVRMPLYTIRS